VVISQGQEPPPGFRGGYSVRKAGPTISAPETLRQDRPLVWRRWLDQLVRSGNFAGRRWPCAP